MTHNQRLIICFTFHLSHLFVFGDILYDGDDGFGWQNNCFVSDDANKVELQTKVREDFIITVQDLVLVESFY